MSLNVSDDTGRSVRVVEKAHVYVLVGSTNKAKPFWNSLTLTNTHRRWVRLSEIQILAVEGSHNLELISVSINSSKSSCRLQSVFFVDNT